MSTESDFIASLLLAQTRLYELGGPILVMLGTVSCILSLAVFTKKNLRKNPCSIYLIAYHVAGLLLIYATILPQTLAKGYNIDPTSYNLPFCRFRFYTTLLSDALGPSYLILASIDRVLLTSQHALTRQRSRPRLAYICIIAVTLFWLLAQSHTLVFCDILVVGPDLSFCYFSLNAYYVFVSYYTVLVKGILIPLFLFVFGFWSIRNVRVLGRIAPVPVRVTNGETGIAGLRLTNSKDRQLLRILLVDISVYLIFSLMMSIVFMYQQIITDQSQSFDETRHRAFFTSVSVFSAYIPSCIGFYNNLLVSATFRREARNVFMCKWSYPVHDNQALYNFL